MTPASFYDQYWQSDIHRVREWPEARVQRQLRERNPWRELGLK